MIVYKGRLLKKSSLANQKLKLIQSTLVTTWLSNIAFHLLPIWLQTLVAIDSELCQTLFQSFCVLPSEVTVLFKWNLSRLPFLGQVVNLDLLRCTRFNSEHVALFLCHNFTQSLMKDWKIQKTDGHSGIALVSTNFWPIPSTISFHIKLEVFRCGQKFTNH